MMTAKATILIDIKRTKHTNRDEIMAHEVDMRDENSRTKQTVYIPKAAPSHKRGGEHKVMYIRMEQTIVYICLASSAVLFLPARLQHCAHIKYSRR